ncbi:hypothetical protein DFA_03282 [Cavenderia fasciculata]|uniref:Uncharacterized protein n=1 Tax=Cavenderia fasciculata TaxID=261658 RepID=F4PH52_CACFS|nr:uncharacterized protein DFA_03282 [Cavenderia fasciculata]EGG25036.1 hypothetical protein DFA_03282 [Cavenderia fasciculata]|eukprot:XP_004362887.1 hypothetical protein DFA_03282 [Cavenderia fasciculata]
MAVMIGENPNKNIKNRLSINQATTCSLDEGFQNKCTIIAIENVHSESTSTNAPITCFKNTDLVESRRPLDNFLYCLQ